MQAIVASDSLNAHRDAHRGIRGITDTRKRNVHLKINCIWGILFRQAIRVESGLFR